MSAIENQRICVTCRNILLRICDILALLSIYKHQQLCSDDLEEDKNDVLKNENFVNTKYSEKTGTNSDNLIAFNSSENTKIKIKEEISDPLPITSQKIPEEIKANSDYEEFLCKNEEIDLKMESNEDQEIEE